MLLAIEKVLTKEQVAAMLASGEAAPRPTAAIVPLSAYRRNTVREIR